MPKQTAKTNAMKSQTNSPEVEKTQKSVSVVENEKPDLISQQFDGVLNTLSTFRQSITALQTQIRGLERTVRKEMKGLAKEAAKIEIRVTGSRLDLLSPLRFRMNFARLWVRILEPKLLELRSPSI